MAYGDLPRYMDLPRRAASDKVILLKMKEKDRCQRGFASMVYKYFEKKFAFLAGSETIVTQAMRVARDKSASGGSIKNQSMSNQELAKELNNSIIGKFEKWKVHSSFIDNIWCADLADMSLKNKFNERNRFLLSVINIFSKHTWVLHGFFFLKL